MLILMLSLAVLGLAAVARSALASLRGLPRTNEDWVWY
jgi:hypothetical protein